MCPVCLANLVLLAAGTTSSGGLAALLSAKILKKNTKPNRKGKQNETARLKN
jgi:hypothetical protein